MFSQLRADLHSRWRIHGFLLFLYEAAAAFDDYYREAIDPRDSSEAYLLLQGAHTFSVASNTSLWRLSRMVAADRELEGAPTNNRIFLSELHAHLDQYGWRADAIFELREPMWRENPAIPLNAIRAMAALPDTEEPQLRLKRAAAMRDRLLRKAQQKLKGNPTKLDRFNWLHGRVREYVRLDEDHNFYIDQMGNVAMRLPVLEFGRRLVAAGAIDSVDDVFMLTTKEIESGLKRRDMRHLVADRRRTWVLQQRLQPPPMLGTTDVEGEDDPLVIAMTRLDAPPEPMESTTKLVRGRGASPGSVRGRAKVAHTLQDASDVQRGEVLVCETALPTWSVLFGTIGAIVADTGGVMSHCATVAREYGIPCVVGTSVGTFVIPDGALVEVDGGAGEVRVLS
jgi:pyruvate,water dikinase